MYWIESGVLCVLQGNLANPRLLAFSHPGQVAGEVALIEEIARTATVAAINPTRLRRLSKEDFHTMLRQKPETALEIMRLLSARLREIQPAEYSDGLYDHLTGTLSRQAFDSLLMEEVDRARNLNYSLALVFLDLDFFKQINDRYGHQRGDEILITFSRRIMEQLRVSDLLFRYGGDEFVLILPGADQHSAPDLLLRILDFVKSTPVPGEPPLFLSFSAGIGFYPEDGPMPEDVLKIADQRLYLAKNAGRGKVTGQLTLK
jgi:diguanylate cyclase (GGDEF)-like protein